MTHFLPPAKPTFSPRKPRTIRQMYADAADRARRDGNDVQAMVYDAVVAKPLLVMPRRAIAIPGVRS